MSILPINIDLIDNIKYSNPRKIDNIYYSDIKYGDKPLIIQINDLIINDDLSDLSENKSYIDFQINSNNIDVYEFFAKLDENNVKTACNNSKSWFNNDLSEVIMEDMYKNIIKPVKANYDPTIKFKLPIKNNKIACNVYNENKELVNINELKSNDTSIILLHISGLKFLMKDYFCDCYISQIKVNINNSKLNQCLINDTFTNEIDNDIIDTPLIENIRINGEISKLSNSLSNKKQSLESLKKEIKQIEKNIKSLNNKRNVNLE